MVLGLFLQTGHRSKMVRRLGVRNRGDHVTPYYKDKERLVRSLFLDSPDQSTPYGPKPAEFSGRPTESH